MTVREEGLAGAADEVVFEVCLAEGRTLITWIVISHRFRGSHPKGPLASSSWNSAAPPRCTFFAVA